MSSIKAKRYDGIQFISFVTCASHKKCYKEAQFLCLDWKVLKYVRKNSNLSLPIFVLAPQQPFPLTVRLRCQHTQSASRYI